MRRWSLAAAIALAAACASQAGAQPSEPSLSIATDTLKFGARPDWVKPLDAPIAAPRPPSGALQALLFDTQARLGADGEEVYIHAAYRALDPTALTVLGNFQTIWDPSSSTVTVHAVRVYRDGQWIDVLGDGKDLVVLRRETQLALATLDGRLTATQPIPGLRVGDVLEYEYTVRHADPVLADHAELTIGIAANPQQPVVTHWRERVLWPAKRPMQWRVTEGMDPPQQRQANGEIELVEDQTDLKPSPPPTRAPPRYGYRSRLEVTDFADWRALSMRLAPLFQKAAELPPDSPLIAEADNIAKAAASPAERASRALALVQTQVRYQALLLGEGGLAPVSADQTWARRYGDCKGKSVLLLALLQRLGIEAQPVMVSTSLGDGLDAQLPQATDFNHVIVRARVDGRWYWLDGTRPGDPAALDDLAAPSFRWGLPLTTAGETLTAIEQTPPREPLLDIVNRFDGTDGLYGLRPAHATLVVRGDVGIVLGVATNALPPASAEQLVRSFLARAEPNFAIKTVSWRYDKAKAAFSVDVDGQVRLSWRWDAAKRAYAHPMGAQTVSLVVPGLRKGGVDPSAPFVTQFPLYNHVRNEITLPNGGAGFTVTGAPMDRTLDATEFARSAKIEGGKVIFEGVARTLAPEFTLADAAMARAVVLGLRGDPIELLPPQGFPPPPGAPAQPPAAAPSAAAAPAPSEAVSPGQPGGEGETAAPP